MDIDAVPQEGNATQAGHRKAMYARDAEGHIVIAPSRGWEAEEIVTRHAVESIEAQAEAARARVEAGESSPLEYWMYARRMDVALLAQTSGFWQWRVRRHLQPRHFARLADAALARYAEALGLPVETIRHLPSTRDERRARATQGPLHDPAKPARIPPGDRSTYSSGEGQT
jgi:hypothetical protein